jgi:carboxymethylenebutenolidase
MLRGDLTAQTVMIAGDSGDPIEAYLARPGTTTARGSVVVIHHLPGYDRATKEITRRFAELGYDAICPNLYWREAPGADPSDAAALVRSHGGVADDRVVGDVEGAIAYLRAQPESNQRVASIGYCSGGRHSVLAGCRLRLEGVIDCYGGLVTGTPPPGYPLLVRNLVRDLPALSAPLLGLFGKEDTTPSPAHVAELESILLRHGKDHELHEYDGAGHAFFAVDRPAYRVKAANDGWQRIEDFLGSHVGRDATVD